MYLLQMKSVKPVNEEKPLIDDFNDFEARKCYSVQQRKPKFYLGIVCVSAEMQNFFVSFVKFVKNIPHTIKRKKEFTSLNKKNEESSLLFCGYYKIF